MLPYFFESDEVVEREFRGGLCGDWFDLLPDLIMLKTLRCDNAKQIAGSTYCDSLRELVFTAAAHTCKEAGLDKREYHRILAAKVKTFFRDWAKWRSTVSTNSHETASLSRAAERYFWQNLLCRLLIESSGLDTQWLLLHARHYSILLASSVLEGVLENTVDENIEEKEKEHDCEVIDGRDLQSDSHVVDERIAQPPNEEETNFKEERFLDGATGVESNSIPMPDESIIVGANTSKFIEADSELSIPLTPYPPDGPLDFSVLLDVGPGREDEREESNALEVFKTPSEAEKSKLIDEKTRAVRAVFRVRERLESAERDLKRAAADREQAERRHKQELEQLKQKHALELEAVELRVAEERFQIEKKFQTQLSVEQSRVKVALEIAENLKALFQNSVLSDDAANTANAASAASAAASAAIDAANAAVTAANALAVASTPSPPKEVGVSELRFVGGFVALSDEELAALGENDRQEYEARQRTHLKLMREATSKGGMGGKYLGYGGGRSRVGTSTR